LSRALARYGGNRPSRLVLRPLGRAIRATRSVILGYHGVGSTSPGDDPSSLRVPVSRFRSQLEFLLDAQFAFVTVTQLAERSDGAAPPAGFLALTFDDGMADNYSTVLPILQEYRVPATVYVTTGLIGKPNPFLSERSGQRMMTVDELKALAAAGIELGAHTVTHPDLSTFDYESCLREMLESSMALESLTGVRPRTFAYPFCRYGAEAKAAARDAGFDAAVTCTGRGSWDRFELRRSLIGGADGNLAFVLKLADVHQSLRTLPLARAVSAARRAPRTGGRVGARTGPGVGD
jgi:peptidoglycan/xylan/chitin deacetylase (PgdA/CDA1 family)